jgi:hypothetical protein
MQQAQQQSEMNAQQQAQAAQVANEGAMQLKQLELQATEAKIKAEGLEQQKTAVINMFTQIFSKGMVIPAELQPLSQSVIQNIMIPLIAETERGKAANHPADAAAATGGDAGTAATRATATPAAGAAANGLKKD